MTLLLPAGLTALILAAPVIVLHMLTPRRPATQVSSLLHWDGLRHSITAAEPWQRLRWSLLLVLQLLAVALFAFALARPALVEESQLAEHTVYIVDASGSMAALDGDPDRLAAAVGAAEELRARGPDRGVASLIVASSHPAVLVEQSGDIAEFERALNGIRTDAGAADYESAFSLAESLVVSDRATDFVLISDGQLDESEQRLAPLGTRFIPVGRSDTNRSITDLSVMAGPGGLQARVTIESNGGADARQTLRLDVDGVTVVTREIDVPRGGVVEEVLELPEGTRVAAYLDGDDLLGYDNQRYAAAPVIGSLKARIHGQDTFFVSQLLSAMPEVDTQVAPSEEVDFEVYAGVPLPGAIDTPFIAIDVPGGAPGISPVGRVQDPVPTLVARHPLLEDIDVSRIAIAEAQQVEVSSGEVILGAPGAPLIVAGETNGLPFYYIAFPLEQSNLPIDIAYPIIGARMVGALATAEGVSPALTVGDRLPTGGDGTVTDPRGSTTIVSAGDSQPTADLSGFWTVSPEGGQPFEVAVNPDTRESELEPIGALPEIRPLPDGAQHVNATTTVSHTLLPWVLLVLFAVLAIELWVSRRRRGVTQRQWRWGMTARASIVLLLVLALVDPPFATSSDRVSTVFVVDVSASMGTDAREAARAWVESALTHGGGGRWAVVEFGSDARVGTAVGNEPYRRARGIDTEATNVARGLRLGESVLTGETRERIVLVSDGRANTGDLQAELDRLRALGVVVDVHTVAATQQADAAVAVLDSPSAVNSGESFQVTVEVLSTISGSAEVELTDGLGGSENRQVELVPGPNQVAFTVTADQPGLQELTARVDLAGDAVEDNDLHRAGVEVRGPASILVVEGEHGNGAVLEDALASRELVVERTPVRSLPDIEALAVHKAVVLVDVSARDLSDDQVSVLRTFVSDLGRGLITVGGTDSYGLGGYRDTPLEAMLPVDAEPPDTEREAEVAEVLLIDTSESMGACHCADGGTVMNEGGVNKTDISKAAAVRAADALSGSDQLGLLAFSGTTEWVIPLQPVPDQDTITQGVGSLRPFGETKVIPALQQAAEALLESDKELKHIILFTDGFTVELDQGADFVGGGFAGDLVEAVDEIAAQGITVSVVGTGEGALPALEEVAEAGNGRFYPGRDLEEIPEIFVQEARIAARSFINEGEFFPVVTSTAEAVRDLGSSPALLGYVATAPKPTAEVQLQVGELADPLLASWRVGLGRVTAWTSDSGERWAAGWAGWDGFADFWSAVVRDTFPLTGSEGERIDASISDELLTITLEGSEAWPAGTEPAARIGYPDGTTEELRLDRVSDFEFEAVAPARQGGTYAVGVSVDTGQETLVLSTLATRSFAAEFLPGDPDTALMAGVSAGTGGRGEIAAEQAFDLDGLEAGVSERHFRWWFLLAAALIWPIDVALRRLRMKRRERGDRRWPPRRLRPRPTTPAASPGR